MKVIHMNTEQVRTTAKQLERTSSEIEDQVSELVRRVLTIPWQGASRESYINEIGRLAKNSQMIAQQGLDLSLRVCREVDEWESVAASFGLSGAAGITAITTGTGGVPEYAAPPLNNMRDLAALVMNGDGVIRIYRIGENQYLLVVQGTNINDPNVSNNMGSAITTGLGLPSDFQNQVKLALLSLPSGAIVHMAGHSQGGIVSENLAVDKEVKKHFDEGRGIQSVTTFGSPVSAPENTYAKYRRYAAEGDIVPYLEGRDALTTLLLTPIVGAPRALATALLDRAPQTSIPANFSGGVFGPHGEYSKSESLQNAGLPFTADEEYLKIKPTTYDPGTARSGLAVVQKNLAPIAKAAGSFAHTAGKAISGAATSTGNFFSNLF